MSMMRTIVSKTKSIHLEKLYEWFVEEWKEVEPFETNKEGIELPPPIIALENNELARGLSFTCYPIPGDEMGLWVNALLVTPEKRGKGIGSDLVRKAMEEVSKLKFKEVYVRTEVPSLYQNLGWLRQSSNEEGTILKTKL